jgi:two-component sensor histidine kinase
LKNNLQVISSIMNLQSGYVGEDPKMLELLRDSQDRIRSMSFIHESPLPRRRTSISVDLGVYIESLSRNLVMSYRLGGQVRLETKVENVELGLDQAHSLWIDAQ